MQAPVGAARDAGPHENGKQTIDAGLARDIERAFAAGEACGQKRGRCCNSLPVMMIDRAHVCAVREPLECFELPHAYAWGDDDGSRDTSAKIPSQPRSGVRGRRARLSSG